MMRLIAPVMILSVAALFGWIAIAPWLQDPSDISEITLAADAEVTALPDLPVRPGQADLSGFANRPLFSAARRPPPPEELGEPVEDPMADMLFGRYEVAGVVQLGDKSVAMLRDMRDGKLIRIRRGDRVGNADVVEITLESLTFSQGGATVTAPVAGTGADKK